MPFKKVNFQLVTPYLDLDVRDFEVDFAGVNMPVDIQPNTVLEDDGATATHALVDGEWMMLSAKGKKITRAIASTESEWVTAPCFPLYAERGRTELMALNKAPIIWRGSFEADTHMVMNGNQTKINTYLLGARLAVAGAEKPGTVADTPMHASEFFSVLDAKAVDTTSAATMVNEKSGRAVGFVVRAAADNGGRGIRVYCSLGLGL